MSDQHSSHPLPENISREELQSALFVSLVMQQANMAMIFLGKLPHPESGKTECDLEAAQLFIDNLEMLEAKTKGNLTAQEQGMLKQNLMSLRMAFVAVVEMQPSQAAAPVDAPASGAPAESSDQPSAGSPSPQGDAASDARKKFVKKY